MKDLREIIAKYPVTLEMVSEAEGGGYVAYCAAFPGMLGDGGSAEAAMEDLRLVLEDAVQERMAKDIPLPTANSIADQCSGRISLRISPSLHGQLARRAEREQVSINALLNELIAYGLGARHMASLLEETVQAMYSPDCRIPDRIALRSKPAWNKADYTRNYVGGLKYVQ